MFNGASSEVIVRATGMDSVTTLTFSGQGINAPNISGLGDQDLTVNAILDSNCITIPSCPPSHLCELESWVMSFFTTTPPTDLIHGRTVLMYSRNKSAFGIDIFFSQ